MKQIEFDFGDIVVCDYCDKEYTNSKESGGFLFGSYATCPSCAPDMEKKIKGYGEEWNIRLRCPKDKSFADWVRQDLRGK